MTTRAAKLLLRSGLRPTSLPPAWAPPRGVRPSTSSARSCSTGQVAVDQHNPMRVVRKPPARPENEVRPLAPSTIEAMRAAYSARDAVLVSVLAYARLRPTRP